MIRHVSQSEYLRSPTASYRQSGVVELPFIEHQGEPLLVEVQHFFDCVEHRLEPRVSGADGLESVRWALRVTEAARLSRWKWRSNGAAPG
jgi:predicted dehydrogenase